jgi:hypothetical protein
VTEQINEQIRRVAGKRSYRTGTPEREPKEASDLAELELPELQERFEAASIELDALFRELAQRLSGASGRSAGEEGKE